MNLDELTWHLPWTSSQSSCEKCSRARVLVSSECSCFFREPWVLHCRCIVAVSVLRQSFCPADRLTMAPPLDRNPLRRTLEYTLIHREVPKPIEEQRRALNKQIKGRLTVGSIQWSANGQRGLWQFTAPPFTPRPRRRRRRGIQLSLDRRMQTTRLFHSIWYGRVVESKVRLQFTEIHDFRVSRTTSKDALTGQSA